MHKIYLLLRDNKQTGPYNLEELRQLSLKPFDLIWVDGRSTGWQYPNEIEALKPFTPEPPQKLLAETVKFPGPAQAPSAAPIDTTPDYSPKIPASAKHIFVSFPSFAPHGSPVNNKPEESEEYMLERKAEEIRARVQAFSEGKSEPEENAELHTGYTRSLEDMKAEYTSWVYQQQKKKKSWLRYRKALLVAVMVLALSLTGYFSGRKVLNVLSKMTHTVAMYLAPEHGLGARQDKKEPDNLKEKQPVVLAKNTNIPALPPSLLPETGNTTDNNDKPPVTFPQKATVKKLPAAMPRISSGINTHNKPGKAILNTAEKTDKSTAAEPEQQPLNTEAVSPSVPSAAASVPLSKLIEVTDNNLPGGDKNSSAEHQLTVQNNSDHLVNTVAVDIYYYKGKKLLGKKVIYFDNIPPQSSLTLPLPRQKKADTTSYHIGLISSKNGVYYLR